MQVEEYVNNVIQLNWLNLTFFCIRPPPGLLPVLDPNQDSSIGSISAWYRGVPGFKFRQGQEFFSENK